MILFPKIYTIRRKAGAYVRGVWTDTATTMQIVADIQTATDKDIKSLPVDRQTSGKIKIYSMTELLVAKQGTQQQSDLVEWNGKLWEVISSETHQNNVMSHYKAMAEYVSDL